jgi:hypothetical protein
VIAPGTPGETREVTILSAEGTTAFGRGASPENGLEQTVNL